MTCFNNRHSGRPLHFTEDCAKEDPADDCIACGGAGVRIVHDFLRECPDCKGSGRANRASRSKSGG